MKNYLSFCYNYKVFDWLNAHAEIYSKATRVRERINEGDAIYFKMGSG